MGFHARRQSTPDAGAVGVIHATDSPEGVRPAARRTFEPWLPFEIVYSGSAIGITRDNCLGCWDDSSMKRIVSLIDFSG
jgi:hypothetical protein